MGRSSSADSGLILSVVSGFDPRRRPAIFLTSDPPSRFDPQMSSSAFTTPPPKKPRTMPPRLKRYPGRYEEDTDDDVDSDDTASMVSESDDEFAIEDAEVQFLLEAGENAAVGNQEWVGSPITVPESPITVGTGTKEDPIVVE